MVSYGAVEAISVPRTRSRATLFATLAAGAALALVVFVVANGEGSATSLMSLVWVPVHSMEVEEPYMIMPRLSSHRVMLVPMERDALMLYDSALDPLYKDTEDPIEAYKWLAKHKDEYDPEIQNAFADLPMKKADIKDPDSEFYGKSDKDMSKSCDKTKSCKEEDNAWSGLPEEEEKNLAKRNKEPPADPAWDAWSKMPLDY